MQRYEIFFKLPTIRYDFFHNLYAFEIKHVTKHHTIPTYNDAKENKNMQ